MLSDRVARGVTGTQLDLLRGFELRHNGDPVGLPLGAQRVVAFLAIHRRAVQRAFVAGTLWIDYSQEAANANLRTTLWRLRRPPCVLVDATPSRLSLAPSVDVDLHRVIAVAQRLAFDRCVVPPEEVPELTLAGELLPDWYDDWVVIERERFRQVRLHALEALCEWLSMQSQYALAVDAGLAAVAGEPLRESAHRAVMRAHLAEGNRVEALRQYRLCRRLLHEQLGLEPTTETELLRDRCEHGDGVVTRAM
jgi:DNA-binding SARP family transcriptional activator